MRRKLEREENLRENWRDDDTVGIGSECGL